MKKDLIHFSKEKYLFLSVIISILFTSCSATKYLPEGEELYTGYHLNIDKQSKKLLTDEAISEVQQTIQPKRNKKLFGIRFKLFFYNITSEPKNNKKSGWRYFWKYKAGEEPVLLSNVNADQVVRLMRNGLQNNGYFFSDASFQVNSRKKKASVTYTIVPGQPYFISEIVYPQEISRLTKKIDETKPTSLVKPGDQYNLNTLKSELTRIDGRLKMEGYFFFNPDYLIFKADSGVGDRKVKMELQLKDNLPDDAVQYYRIHNISLFPEFTFKLDSTKGKPDTTFIDSVYYISYTDKFRPEILLDGVYFSRNEVYNSNDYDLTLRRLTGLGMFQYGTIKFEKVPSPNEGKEGLLDANILLTPFPRSSLRAELQLATKSNNYLGPGVNLIFRSRNVFRGAEQFVVKLNGNYEQQFGKNTSGFTSYEAGIEPQLSIPRFITPIKIKRTSSYFVPKTYLSAGYNLKIRQGFYTLNALKFDFGYNWKETLTKEHNLEPFSISYVNPTHTSPAFDSILALYPTLENSFQQQFILGTTYTYTFTDQAIPEHRNHFYFRGKADFSGNTAGLIQSFFESSKPNDSVPYEIFQTPYSMFAKAETDFRIYLKTGEDSRLVSRLFAGAGFPYGNSISLPDAKAFSSGGVNSLRGFRAKSVGPGSFFEDVPDELQNEIEFTSDIKLEANIEYRFPIYGYVKGAVFTDAGNIWAMRPDYWGEAGVFRFSKFMNELAVSSGVGLRIDADFFVIRLDLAFPVRKPSLADGERWVINDIDFGSPGWRKDNLILNIAIGYPF